MWIWYLLGAVSFVVAMAGTIMANVYTTRMIGAINRARRDEPPISPLGFTPGKALRVYRDYRRLVPEGTLHVDRWASFAVAAGGWLGVAISLAALAISRSDG